MLKHILNGGPTNRNVQVVDRNNVKQPNTLQSNGGIRGMATAQPQQQSQSSSSSMYQPNSRTTSTAQPLEALTAELQNRLRCAPAVVEPEYQNTRLHSPHSDFYRGVRLNRSIRSVENVCEAEPQQSHVKRPLDLQWGRHYRPGVAETLHNPRLYSRGSVLNHSYAGTTQNPHPFIVGQHHNTSINQRLNQTDIINLSSGVSPTFTPIANGSTTKIIANGGLHIPKSSPLATTVGGGGGGHDAVKTDSQSDVSKDNNNNNNNNNNSNNNNGGSFSSSGGGGGGTSNENNDIFCNGVKEILTSLGLLCLISLLLALLSLIFLLKISPVTAADMKDLLRAEQFTIISPDEYVTVYEVTLALCALSLSLNLCCLLVCSVQFLFAVKLIRSSVNGDRTNKYLQKSAITRVCAIAGFFISIPVFLTGVILYTFIQFHSTPAIITSVLIGSGIVFCGCAMVHNVFVWQREKTNAVKALVRKQRLHQQIEASKRSNSSKLDTVGTRETSATALSTMSTLPPHVTVDMSSVTSTPHELSTLV